MVTILQLIVVNPSIVALRKLRYLGLDSFPR